MPLPRHRRRARRRRAIAALALAAACHAAAPIPALAQGGKAAVSSLIERGSTLFEDQQYEESIQTLSAALVRPGATEAEKIETYRLLAYNFIILKRMEEADAAVRAILVLKEDYALPPSESPRFREAFAATKKKWIDEGKPGRAAAGAAAGEKPIKMEHASPAEASPGSTIKLSGMVDDPELRVGGVQLVYRSGSKGRFTTVAATYLFGIGQFQARIPGTAVKAPLVEYYLQAVDKSGLPLASRGDAAAPLRVVVSGGGVLTSPFFWVPVGVVVVGGAVATAFIIANSKGTSQVTVNVRE